MKLLHLLGAVLLLAQPLAAYHDPYPQAKPSFHYTAQYSSNPYHNYMMQLAANPALAYNDALVQELLDYMDKGWSNTKRDIMQVLASNPSACTNPRLAKLVQQEIQYQRKQDAFEAGCVLAAAAVVGTICLICALFKIEPARSTRYGTAH